MRSTRRLDGRQRAFGSRRISDRLGHWLDDKRWDDGPSLLAEDVTVATPGGSAQGIEAVVDQARRNHSVDATHHIMATIDVDVDGDQATARANSIATFVPSAGRPRACLIHGERYRFRAVRTSDGWRLSRVEVSPVWEADLRDYM